MTQRKEHKTKHKHGNQHDGGGGNKKDTNKNKQTQKGHGHSVFPPPPPPPPPIWHHVLGSYHLCSTREGWGWGGQRVQGRNMLNHSRWVVTLRSPWSLPQMMRWGLDLALHGQGRQKSTESPMCSLWLGSVTSPRLQQTGHGPYGRTAHGVGS